MVFQRGSNLDNDLRRFQAYQSRCMGAGSNGPDRAIDNALEAMKKSVCPTDVFQRRLAQDPRFEMLLGTSAKGASTNIDGSLSETWVGLPSRTGKSEFHKFLDTDTGKWAIVFLPEHREHCCRVHLQIVWVDEKWGGLGIATRAVKALQEITLQVDEMCRDEEATYRDRTIRCSELSLWLAPCCFSAPDWDVGDDDGPGGPSFLTEVDWSNPDKATKGIEDDSGEQLAPELTRLDWAELRDWYKRLGFVEVDGLDYSEEWNEEHLRVVRHPMKRPRSFEIGRYPMFWPPENAQGYMKEEDKEE